MQDLGKNSGITEMLRGSLALTWHSLNICITTLLRIPQQQEQPETLLSCTQYEQQRLSVEQDPGEKVSDLRFT